MNSVHDDLKIRISVIGKGDRGHAKNKSATWGALKKKLAKPFIDKRHSYEEFKALPTDKQLKIKDVGSFCGGPFQGGVRKLTHLLQRSVITLDIDEITPEQVRHLKRGVSEACGFEFFGSTTRKHTKKNPRWRIVFPLTRALTVDEYAPAARILASKVLPGKAESMDAVDDVSFRPAQIMYWPSISYDGDFETLHNEGELLDPDKLLEDFGDWWDWTKLPYSEKRGMKRPNTGQAPEDPRTKNGVIGAFCRAYDIEQAIAEFLPDTYEPGDEHSNKPRYTYCDGSSSNGAVVEDDGLFLYSHHGSDPVAENLVNAFDLVRIHLFGELDEAADEYATPTTLPSFKAMTKLVLEDENARAELDDDFEPFEEVKFSDLGDSHEDDGEEENEADDDTDADSQEDEDCGDDMPDMSLLHGATDSVEFPTKSLGPYWSRQVHKWANEKSAPVDYAAISLLAGAAGLIGNARRVQPRPGWVEPCILWAALIGTPSSKKSPAMDPISDALEEIEKDFIAPHKEELRLWEADKRLAESKRRVWEARLNEQVESACAESFDEEDEGDEISNEFGMMPKDCIVPDRPVRRRVTVDDTTIEALMYNLKGNPRGLLAVHDELSAWYSGFTRYSGSQSSTDRSTWLKAYGGRKATIDRVKHLDDPVTIPNFSVSILGGLQPDRLNEFLKLSDDGLQARFIYAWPNQKFERMKYLEDLDDGGIPALRKLSEVEMEIDENGHPEPDVLKMTKGAWERFNDWSHNRAIDERFSYGIVLGAYGKADGLVARLALVLEYLWWSGDVFGTRPEPRRVTEKAVKAAIQLREEYIKPMQQKVFGVGSTKVSSRSTVEVANWIAKDRPTDFTIRDLTHKHCVLPRGDIEMAQITIGDLVKARWIVEKTKKPGKKGGRPTKYYVVRKDVLRAVKRQTKALKKA